MAKYIDADKLKEHIKDLPTWWADDGGVYGHSMKYPEGMFDCEDIINSIDNQPTADVVEVKHGEWIANLIKPWNGVVVNWKCSVCEGISSENINYCPHCGAKMDGGKTE